MFCFLDEEKSRIESCESPPDDFAAGAETAVAPPPSAERLGFSFGQRNLAEDGLKMSKDFESDSGDHPRVYAMIELDL